VVAELGGVQAQVFSAAELAVWARVEITLEELRAAIWERRELVKVWGPRGTLHLLPANELPMWMAVLRLLLDDPATKWQETIGITREQVAELIAATRVVLDGQRLTREELANGVAKRIGSWAVNRLNSPWGDLLAPAAAFGAVCFGPNQGSRATFVRADQWIGGWTEVEPREAAATLLRRFLRAYGPSTPTEFGRWSGMHGPMSTNLFKEMAPELDEVKVDGFRGWQLADEPHGGGKSPPIVRLLPQYDAYVLGSRPREQLIDEATHRLVLSHGRGRFEGATGVPVVMVDGWVVGVWERRARGRSMEIGLKTAHGLSAAQKRLLDEEVARIGSFLGLDATLL